MALATAATGMPLARSSRAWPGAVGAATDGTQASSSSRQRAVNWLGLRCTPGQVGHGDFWCHSRAAHCCSRWSMARLRS